MPYVSHNRSILAGDKTPRDDIIQLLPQLITNDSYTTFKKLVKEGGGLSQTLHPKIYIIPSNELIYPVRGLGDNGKLYSPRSERIMRRLHDTNENDDVYRWTPPLTLPH